MNRRDFVQRSSVLAAGALILPNSLYSFGNNTKSKVRLGFIATGFRGQTHIAEMLKRNDIEIKAIADPDKYMLSKAQQHKTYCQVVILSCCCEFPNLLRA